MFNHIFLATVYLFIFKIFLKDLIYLFAQFNSVSNIKRKLGATEPILNIYLLQLCDKVPANKPTSPTKTINDPQKNNSKLNVYFLFSPSLFELLFIYAMGFILVTRDSFIYPSHVVYIKKHTPDVRMNELKISHYNPQHTYVYICS